MDSYDRVIAALKYMGFLVGGRPTCPTCPPHKRRGFTVTRTKTPAGHPTVLLHCFRGCGLEEILETIGLDPADLYDGGQRQEVLFEKDRYCRVTTQGWKALPRSVARTFGIAASIGFYATNRSPFTLLRSRAQWDAVRGEAELGDADLRQQITTWRRARMAHRCDLGVLALYRGPLDRCPNCGRLTLEERRRAFSKNENEKNSQTLQPFDLTTTRKYAEDGKDLGANRHAPDTTQRTQKILARNAKDLGAFEADLGRGGSS